MILLIFPHQRRSYLYSHVLPSEVLVSDGPCSWWCARKITTELESSHRLVAWWLSYHHSIRRHSHGGGDAGVKQTYCTARGIKV